MSLEAEFARIPPSPSKCTTCIWYSQLEPQDRDFFDVKIAGGSTGDKKKMWKAASANGLTISESSFRDCLSSHAAFRNNLKQAHESR